ncbi:MAG: VWA domain-containing protein [Saprospiraceae bacterium]|nr:VWA domain-containing protein [Saprospiraceae bacterium]
MLDLSFQYPAWFLIFCVLLGLGYALLLYYRDTTFREQAPRLHRWLAVLRFLAVTLLSAMLLSPLLKSLLTETRKPVVVLAQDQSESIGADLKDASLEAYKQQWQSLRDALSENYDLHEVSFGDEVREGVNFEFTEKVTNLSELMRGIYDLYGGQNLGAVVVASDGIYNEGSNPVYSDAQLAAPVYTIALGDTTPKKDLLVKRVFHNKIAYLGDRFSVQIDVAATNCGGQQSVLTVSKVEGDQLRTLQSIPVTVSGNDFFTTKEVNIEADQPGVAQYRISVAKLPGEASEANNRKDIFIDVLDARQKILLLANSPHPDISAIRQTLESNKNYQVAIAYAGDPGVDFAQYDFVVLHNLPSGGHPVTGVLRVLNDKRIPRLFVAGMQTNYSALGREQGLVTVQSDGRQSDDVQGKVSQQFAAFSLDPAVQTELPRFNPLTSAFGNFSATPQAQVLLWKRIGKIDTEQPLLAFGETNGIKTGVLLGEGLWRWRLFDYLQHQNHEIVDELVGKSVQYLSLKEDKRKFRVNLDKNIFNENEPVTFGAELYNDNYELTNDPDVAMSIRNRDGKEFTYTFNKLGKAYSLNAGILPVGAYTFKAGTNFNGQNLLFEGRFNVQPIQLELFETTAHHGVLRQLSQQFGGETVFPNEMAAIAEKIKNNQTVKPVIYQTTKTNPLINLKWIFALLAGLLAAEWFLRRYFGAY